MYEGEKSMQGLEKDECTSKGGLSRSDCGASTEGERGLLTMMAD